MVDGIVLIVAVGGVVDDSVGDDMVANGSLLIIPKSTVSGK